MADDQCFDFTIRVDMKAGFYEKIAKYGPDKTRLTKKVIPIVINPFFEIHPDSKRLLAKYLNLPTLFKCLGFWLGNLLESKRRSYNEGSKRSNTNHVERLIQNNRV